MPPLFHDTFTDTNGKLLTEHTSDSGHTWSVMSHLPNASYSITGNRARCDVVGYMTPSAVPSVSEYDIAWATYWGGTGNGAIGVFGRGVTSNRSSYAARNGTTGGLELARSDANGAYTQLGGSYSQTRVVGETYNYVLEIRNDRKALWVDGVLAMTSTDNSINRTGVVGLIASAHATRAYDHFTVTEFVPPRPSFWSHSQVVE